MDLHAAARRADLTIAVLRLFAAGHKEGDLTLRFVFTHPVWFVPLDTAGAPLLREVEGVPCVGARVEPGADPCRPTTAADLVRHPPAGSGGIEFEPDRPHRLAIAFAESGALLAHWASVTEVEATLRFPTTARPEVLLAHDWLRLEPADPADRTIRLFTSTDVLREYLTFDAFAPNSRYEAHEPEVRSVPGRELFAALAAEPLSSVVTVNAETTEAVPNPLPESLLAQLGRAAAAT